MRKSRSKSPIRKSRSKSRSRSRKRNTSDISTKPFKTTSDISTKSFKKSNSENIEKYTMWFNNKKPPPQHINKLILEFKYKGCTSPFLVPIKENFMTLRSKKEYKTGLYNYPNDSNFIVLIERVGKIERVVGFAVLTVFYNEIYVDDLCTWVDTKGNGKMMINIIKEWAGGSNENSAVSIDGYKRPKLKINMSQRTKGVNITLYSLKEAIGFYRHMGFSSLLNGKSPCSQMNTIKSDENNDGIDGKKMGICIDCRKCSALSKSSSST